MSATDETDALTDHQYFQAIEETFVRLRGAPLLLPPKDWRTASAWHREGIPLDLVLRTLEEVFERRRERDEEGKVSSLRYCDRAVREAWREASELTAAAAARRPGAGVRPAGGMDPVARLDALAKALPADLPGRDALAGAIRGLAEGDDAHPGPGTAGEVPLDERQVEKRLAALDRQALERLVEALDPEQRARFEAEVDRAVRGMAARIPREESEKARRRLLEQKVRRLFALPTLSLFAPEAEPERGDPTGD